MRLVQQVFMAVVVFSFLVFPQRLVRANYNDLQNSVHATTKFLEMFFSNLILGTEYELKNRYMHVGYVDDNSQSVTPKAPKSQFDTLNVL